MRRPAWETQPDETLRSPLAATLWHRDTGGGPRTVIRSAVNRQRQYGTVMAAPSNPICLRAAIDWLIDGAQDARGGERMEMVETARGHQEMMSLP